MSKIALAVRHIHFEDLGTFEGVLEEAGYETRYCDACIDDLVALDPLEPDLVIVLGGPVGTYETSAYPFLSDEISLLEKRLAGDRPTFGICLGAQLIATALGAQVKPTGIKEIGFAALSLNDAGQEGPLGQLANIPVLHWHGDMFDIPNGAMRLAATALCANQAFSVGRNIMGVQFHPEVDAGRAFERWLVGHASELSGAGIDPRELRLQAEKHCEALRRAGRAMFGDWLSNFD
jgi:GMP synthase (glutamine-hydrolysing)